MMPWVLGLPKTYWANRAGTWRIRSTSAAIRRRSRCGEVSSSVIASVRPRRSEFAAPPTGRGVQLQDPTGVCAPVAELTEVLPIRCLHGL